MGIQLANVAPTPAITYNHVHLTKLEIIQPTFEDDTQQPKYQVEIYYRHYGIVGTQRFYKTEDLQRITISDYIALALQDAGQGDMTLFNSLQGIEVAVAAIITDQLGVTASVTNG